MNVKAGLGESSSFVVDDALHKPKDNETSRQAGKKNCTLVDGKSKASTSLTVDTFQPKPIRSRVYSSIAHKRLHLFERIQEVISRNVGAAISINQERLVFDVTKKFCLYQDEYFSTSQYHALLEEILEGTDIPDLIRDERMIPVARKGDNEKQIVLEFIDAHYAYAHTLDGQETALETKPVFVSYNPEALTDVDTSMLRVGTNQFGFTDGSPRYIFTTDLGPCICVTLFDRSQNKVLLGHFLAFRFTLENLSELVRFCEDKKMKNLECHIVGGTYEDLGVENGFSSLMDFITSNGIPIRQMFVGDTTDRPGAVVLDTKDMVLYKLPCMRINDPTPWLETYESLGKLDKIGNMPLLTKNVTHSLLTCSLVAD